MDGLWAHPAKIPGAPNKPRPWGHAAPSGVQGGQCPGGGSRVAKPKVILSRD